MTATTITTTLTTTTLTTAPATTAPATTAPATTAPATAAPAGAVPAQRGEAPHREAPHRGATHRTGSHRAPVDHAAVDLLRTLAGLPAAHRDRPRLRDAAIQAWHPLAKHLAQRFHGRGEPLDDLTQIATVGLIKAIDRFDPEYGNDFAAYAVPTIVGEIKRHFRDRTWDIRVPRRLQELKLDINEATATLAQQLGRSPTVADIAAHLHRSEDEIIEGLEGARAYSAVSLQTLVGSGLDGTELGDLFGIDDPDLALAEFRASLGPALDALSEREQKIITLRFFGNLTQTQIAERVGISQMHVSRLLAKSLATLRGQLTET